MILASCFCFLILVAFSVECLDEGTDSCLDYRISAKELRL